jgi:hypothetical protein
MQMTAFVISGHFLTTLRDLMEITLKRTQRWCQTKGLVVNPLKTNVQIFTRKYKPEPIKPLRHSKIPRRLIRP